MTRLLHHPRHLRPALAATAAISLLGVSATTTTAVAATTPTVTIGVYAGSLLAPEVAVAEGYFKKEGLDVVLKTLAAGPAIVAAAQSGSIDVGFGDTLAWAAAVGNGFTDLDILTGGDTETPSLGSDEHLIGSKSITSPSQLTGKTIGIIPYPEMTVAAKLWLSDHGVNPSTVKFITITDGTQATLLNGGGADVVEGRNIGEDSQIVTQTGGHDFGQIFTVEPQGTINTTYFANKSWLSKDPAVDRKVVAALREGTAFIRTAPAQTLANLATKYAGVDYTTLAKQYPGIVQKADWYREQPGIFSAKDITATNAWIADGVKEGQLKKAFNVTPYLWPTATTANVG